MTEILTAAAVMAGLGLLFGTILALSYRFLKVEEDPRIDEVEEMLPGSNCGACGEPGCRALAEKLVAGVAQPAKCTVSSPDGIEHIAEYLGVEAGEGVQLVARLHCGGGLGRAFRVASYEGTSTCRAAHLVGGGGLECTWGCLGLADCVDACTFDAIEMNALLLPEVDPDLCTACGDCVDGCPRDLFTLEPITHNLVVQCKAPLAAEEARRICQVACDACGRCAADAAPGLIRMENDLPVVDYAAAEGPAEPSATWRCPTGAIRWVEGRQFRELDSASDEDGDPDERRMYA
jgi:Na+-translocating ferredoxin:NAD+ oxidoreductase RNF subunit RnfB